MKLRSLLKYSTAGVGTAVIANASINVLGEAFVASGGSLSGFVKAMMTPAPAYWIQRYDEEQVVEAAEKITASLDYMQPNESKPPALDVDEAFSLISQVENCCDEQAVRMLRELFKLSSAQMHAEAAVALARWYDSAHSTS